MPWLVFGVALVILGLRLPEAVVRAEFWAEDGLFYSDALVRGLASITDPYAGYFIIGIRGVAFLETLGPPMYAPLIGNLLSLGVMASVAAFATSRRMPWNRTTGTMIAAGIVILPIGFELVGTLVHVVWPLMLWMAFVAVSREPSTRAGRTMETVGLVAAGLTGIGGVLVSPLFLRGPRRRLVAVVGVVVVQLLAVVATFGERPGSLGAEWPLVPFIWLLRAVQTPLLGDSLTGALPLVANIIIAGLVAAVAGVLLLRTARHVAALIFLLSFAIPVAGIVMGGEATTALANPAWAPRYFWSAGVGLVVLLALNRRHLAAVPLITLFLFGAALEFDIHPASEMGWRGQSACIGGPEPCEIPVAPGDRWNVKWQP